MLVDLQLARQLRFLVDELSPKYKSVRPHVEPGLITHQIARHVDQKIPYIVRVAPPQNEQVVVVYGPPLESAAREVAEVYPSVDKDLQDIFGWELMSRPRVILINSAERFRKMVRSDIFVAFAVPKNNLVVIDYSKMNISPFTLTITLKHELCHLLLHQHIERRNLPKWLDEGVCQWASDGIAEILINKRQSVFRTSLVAGNLFSFASLADRFPHDKRSLVLAYEQSKSLIDYTVKKYGKERLLDILFYLKNGESADKAVLNSLNVSLTALEDDWRRHLNPSSTKL